MAVSADYVATPTASRIHHDARPCAEVSAGLGLSAVLEREGKRIYTLTPLMLVSTSIMALNLKNAEVERLAAEVARLTGETKTEAIRRALDERRRRLTTPARGVRRERVLRLLKSKVWPKVPPRQLGRRLTKEEEDAILGYGPEGV